MVWTSDYENAETTANVYLTVFGVTGRSQRHILQGQTFGADTEQEFDVTILPIINHAKWLGPRILRKVDQILHQSIVGIFEYCLAFWSVTVICS